MERFGFTLVFSLHPSRSLQGGPQRGKPEWLRRLEAEPIFPERTLASGKADPLGGYHLARVGDFNQATIALEEVLGRPEVQDAFIAPPRGVLGKHAPAADWREQIKLPRASTLSQWKGANRVKVVVVDSGIDHTHPQLEHARVVDFLGAKVRPSDPSGHGTHVSGLIAAKPAKGQDFQGLAHDCVDLTVHRGMSEPYDPGAYYRALRAASEGHLVNLSVGGEFEDPLETVLVNELISQGCIIVAAMGNHGDISDRPAYPAACDGVIAVGSVERDGQRAYNSGYGPHIALSAPGVDIVSTAPTYPVSELTTFGQPPLTAMSGTSMATPIVTAVLAKLLSFKPSLDRQAIIGLVDSRLQGPWNEDLGHGILDAEALLAAL